MTKICYMPFQPFWFLHHSHDHDKSRELIELDDTLDDTTKLTLEICDKIKNKKSLVNDNDVLTIMRYYELVEELDNVCINK